MTPQNPISNDRLITSALAEALTLIKDLSHHHPGEIDDRPFVKMTHHLTTAMLAVNIAIKFYNEGKYTIYQTVVAFERHAEALREPIMVVTNSLQELVSQTAEQEKVQQALAEVQAFQQRLRDVARELKDMAPRSAMGPSGP